MPRLLIEQPGVPPMTVELRRRETRLGRAEENEVVLVADEVSRYHARILHDGDEAILYDLQSLNGTYVNRQRIKERVLSNGDDVWLGSKCRATFLTDAAKPEPPPEKPKPPESTLLLDIKKIREEMDDVTASMTMIAHPGSSASHPTVTDAEPDQELEKMGRAFRRLDAMYKASKLLAADFDLEKRLAEVLDLAIEVTNASRGFLMLREENTEELQIKVAREMGRELEDGSPSEGIARRAAVDGEPVLMTDREADSHFGERESIIRQRIVSAMCVPLKVEDRILGSLYVDSRRYDVRFSEEDLELFQAMADQSVMAIENIRLYEQMLESEKTRANLGRFLSPGLVEIIMNQDREIRLGGVKRTVTILYCDIRGFTPLSEGLTPEDLVRVLNEHFTAMTEIVFQYRGTLDKFIGDEVMALFGAPFSTANDAMMAVQAALAMQERNAALNVQRKKAGLPVFQIGIGINTGEVFTGFIGSPDRLEYTVIGDHVNIASRLCSIARGDQIIAGTGTYELVKEGVQARSAGSPTLKGKAMGVEAFQILGLKELAQKA